MHPGYTQLSRCGESIIVRIILADDEDCNFFMSMIFHGALAPLLQVAVEGLAMRSEARNQVLRGILQEQRAAGGFPVCTDRQQSRPHLSYGYSASLVSDLPFLALQLMPQQPVCHSNSRMMAVFYPNNL